MIIVPIRIPIGLIRCKDFFLNVIMLCPMIAHNHVIHGFDANDLLR